MACGAGGGTAAFPLDGHRSEHRVSPTEPHRNSSLITASSPLYSVLPLGCEEATNHDLVTPCPRSHPSLGEGRHAPAHICSPPTYRILDVMILKAQAAPSASETLTACVSSAWGEGGGISQQRNRSCLGITETLPFQSQTWLLKCKTVNTKCLVA